MSYRPEENRPTGTRNPAPKKIERRYLTFEDAKKRFDESMNHIEGLKKIYTKIKNEPSSEELKIENCLEDLLRSQIVLMVSALDYYMHEVLKCGILKFFNGDWNDTNKTLNKYKIPISIMRDIWINGNNQSDKYVSCIANEISKMFDKDTFQRFDVITDNLNMFGITLPNNFSTYKNFLQDLCDRRNKIAHESDRYEYNKDFLLRRTSISEDQVNNYKTKLMEFVDIIHNSMISRTK